MMGHLDWELPRGRGSHDGTLGLGTMWEKGFGSLKLELCIGKQNESWWYGYYSLLIVHVMKDRIHVCLCGVSLAYPICSAITFS